ncbi:MAG: hypothetical protein ABI896_11045, partial [Actinomycetota bacterium]
MNGDRKPDLATANPWLLRRICRKHGLRAPQHAGPLHGAELQGTDIAGREADDRARQLPRREDPPLLLEEVQEGPHDLAEAQVRHGAAER